MYEQHLTQAGLTADQATIYEILIKTGPLPAGKISQKTPLKRGLVYKLLAELVEIGLVEKRDEPGKVSLFVPAHPLKLKELAEKREQQAKDAQTALGGILPQLTSAFNLISGQPGIRFFEGLDGVRQIYDDMIATGKKIYLVRAIYEPTYYEKALPLVNNFIKQRVKHGIEIEALTPRDEFSQQKNRPEDRSILMRRTWVSKADYSAPVEIDIYGDKIALLSFGQELIGVIIESPQITLALRQLFTLAQRGAAVTKPAVAPSGSAV